MLLDLIVWISEYRAIVMPPALCVLVVIAKRMLRIDFECPWCGYAVVIDIPGGVGRNAGGQAWGVPDFVRT